MAMISADSFRGFDLRSEELNNRLKAVKKEFGMTRALSSRSLTGETRTFAEILDQQVETIVLFYLEVQGILAKQTRLLRDKQISDLQDCRCSLDMIEAMCQRYRDIGTEVVELLVYLERNSIALRRILKRHDAMFDHKMGSMYFDTRLGSHSQYSQLRQLYHQEGIRSIISSLRRGFEELYDARKALIESTEGDFTFTPFTARSSQERWSVKTKRVPRISFKKRMQSFSNFQLIAHERDRQEGKAGDIELADPRANGNSSSRTRSATSLHLLTDSIDDHFDSEEVDGVRKRTLSDLEPVLKRVTDLANRLMKTQSSTTLEFLSTHSSLGLEFKLRDLQRDEDDSADAEGKRVETDHLGLFLNNFLTFLYLANQYVVAPSSAEYATRLGMSSSMSGMIIGLTPAAALVSSLLYSMWSNYSFKTPLLLTILCGIGGNLLYSSALQYNAPSLILLGRLLTGFGGPRVISRRYIADHVSLSDRLYASSSFVTAGALGLACGPLLASLIEVSGVKFTWSVGGRVWIMWEGENAAGWLMALLWGMALVGVVMFFKEPIIRKAKTTKRKESREELKSLLGREGGREGGYGSSKRGTSPLPTQSIVFVETGNELWESPHAPLGGEGSSFPWASSPHANAPQPPHPPPAPLLPPPPSHAPLSEEIVHRKSLIEKIDENGYSFPQHSTHQHEFTRFPASLHPEAGPAKPPSCWDYISLEVHVILFLYVVNKAGQELTVSSMPLLLKEVFHWSSRGVGYYMALIGGLVLPTNIFISSFTKDIEERDMVLKLTYLSLIGVLFLSPLLLSPITPFFSSAPYSLTQYVLGTALVFTSLNALEGVIMSLLAKLISPELAQGTFNSGLLATEAGTFGRVVGDMAITLGGQGAQACALVNMLFLPLGGFLVGTVMVVKKCYNRLVD